MSGELVEVLRRDDLATRYRIEGGDCAPGWVREGKAAWCEFTIWHGSANVSSFGGEVWPAAWPALFLSGAGTAQSGPWTRATPECLDLLAAAVERFERKARP